LAYDDGSKPRTQITKGLCGRVPHSSLDAWALPLVVGQSLPPLYIWLTETLVVSLDLEAAYEQTCRALQIG
jgi:hypothetical protein